MTCPTVPGVAGVAGVAGANAEALSVDKLASSPGLVTAVFQ